jgi:hypothetical protein
VFFLLILFSFYYIDRVTDKSSGMFLCYAFTSRYKEILSKSHSSSVMTTPKFIPRLTREETRGKPNISCAIWGAAWTTYSCFNDCPAAKDLLANALNERTV